MNEFRSQIFGEKRPLLGTKRPRGSNPKHNGVPKIEGNLGQVCVRREESRTTDTRDDDRHRLVGQKATAAYGGDQIEVEIVNLSGGGAMLDGLPAPRIGDRVELLLGDETPVEAVIRWAKQQRVGIEFAHETRVDCTPDQQAELFQKIIEQNFPNLCAPKISVRQPEPQAAATEPAADSSDLRRTDKRHPLIWSGTITVSGHEAVVRLRNISAHGALIESDITLTTGFGLTLDLGAAGSFEATVSWAMGDQAGLRFEREFDITKLALTTPSVVPFEWDAPSYLREASKPSPWEKAWGRVSIEDLAQSLEGFIKH